MRIRRPIATGADWALVRLASGEYLCVDTTTFEALGYMLGWEHEADVIRVFRTFLTHQSVVLDIGANFGLYTALSASIVRNHGRLYAFEGNPAVFDCLQRTIVANRLYFNPNIVAANVLVSNETGRGVLHYSAHLMAGGTMSGVESPEGTLPVNPPCVMDGGMVTLTEGALLSELTLCALQWSGANTQMAKPKER